MKKVVLFFSLLLSITAQADQVRQGDIMLDLKCRGINDSNTYTIKLKATKDGVNAERVKIPASLTILTVPSLENDVAYIPVVYQGIYEHEDVMNTFTSQDRKVDLVVYADELDQTVLSFKSNGKSKEIRLDCRE